MKKRPLKFGAVKGSGNPFNRLIAKIASPEVVVFPVPGEEIFRKRGVHFGKMGLETASNPREANALLIAGPVPEAMAKKIATIFAQMPRPRALIFAGVHRIKSLPPPDLHVNPDEKGFPNLKSDIKKLLAAPFDPQANPFEPDFIREMEERNGKEHHEMHDHKGGHHHSHAKGSQKKEAAEHNSHKNHQAHQHSEQEGQNQPDHDHEAHDEHPEQGKQNHQEDQGNEERRGNGHDHGAKEDSDHERMNHGHHGRGGGMGFMSMVMMTKDIPRSKDGLPMERNEASFGPFFPGLTGGLAFKMTLDGDTVIKAEANKLVSYQDTEILGIKPDQLAGKLADLIPLAPETYRILGEQILAKAAGDSPCLSLRQIAALETERISSHLNWLASFAVLIGNQWMKIKASDLLYAMQNGTIRDEEIETFLAKIMRFGYLRKKLRRAGYIPETSLGHTSGPAARAAGIAMDKRDEELNYSRLGFKPITVEENNAWGRLQVRLEEIAQSLRLLDRIAGEKPSKKVKEKKLKAREGLSSYAMETPRGTTEMTIAVSDGKIKQVWLKPVSNMLLAVIHESVKDMELSDALITIASLDINPYELIE